MQRGTVTFSRWNSGRARIWIPLEPLCPQPILSTAEIKTKTPTCLLCFHPALTSCRPWVGHLSINPTNACWALLSGMVSRWGCDPSLLSAPVCFASLPSELWLTQAMLWAMESSAVKVPGLLSPGPRGSGASLFFLLEHSFWSPAVLLGGSPANPHGRRPCARASVKWRASKLRQLRDS